MNMNIIAIKSHEELQSLSDKLTGSFQVTDTFILRSAIVEGLQNTVQHSNGKFILRVEKDLIMIVNKVQNSSHFKAGIGLRIYSGIFTFQRGDLFFSIIIPRLVGIRELDLESLLV